MSSRAPQLDPSKWVMSVGGNGFGNRELEYYTDRPRNISSRKRHAGDPCRARRRTGGWGLHFGAHSHAGEIFAGIWPVRSTHQGAIGAGHLAGVLDDGRCCRRDGRAWRDRHHGEYRPRAIDGAWHDSRPGDTRASTVSARRSHLPTGCNSAMTFMFTLSSGSRRTFAGMSTASNTTR